MHLCTNDGDLIAILTKWRIIWQQHIRGWKKGGLTWWVRQTWPHRVGWCLPDNKLVVVLLVFTLVLGKILRDRNKVGERRTAGRMRHRV